MRDRHAAQGRELSLGGQRESGLGAGGAPRATRRTGRVGTDMRRVAAVAWSCEWRIARDRVIDVRSGRGEPVTTCILALVLAAATGENVSAVAKSESARIAAVEREFCLARCPVVPADASSDWLRSAEGQKANACHTGCRLEQPASGWFQSACDVASSNPFNPEAPLVKLAGKDGPELARRLSSLGATPPARSSSTEKTTQSRACSSTAAPVRAGISRWSRPHEPSMYCARSPAGRCPRSRWNVTRHGERR